MKHSETLMWKEITETPRVFGEIQAANLAVMQKLVADVKDSGKTNFVAAARGTSDHALIFFKYVLEVNSHYTVGLSAPRAIEQGQNLAIPDKQLYAGVACCKMGMRLGKNR